MDSTQVVGWVSAIFQAYSAQIALLSLIVAGISLYFNYRQVKAGETSAKAAEISAKTAEMAVGEGFRAVLNISIYTKQEPVENAHALYYHFAYIEVINCGNRPCMDITIEFKPSLKLVKPNDKSPLKEECFKHDYLQAGASTFIVQGNFGLENLFNVNEKYNISIMYFDIQRNKVEKQSITCSLYSLLDNSKCTSFNFSGKDPLNN